MKVQIHRILSSYLAHPESVVAMEMDGYTNVCEATSQSHDLSSFRPTHRKGKKLLAEKKRRARINNCLMQIRDIVCHGDEATKDTDIDKMEKAEILEKTLEVLTKLRSDHDISHNSLSSHKAMAVRYASGFNSCAEESIRYIQCSRLIPPEVKHQLQAHLRSISRRIESSLNDTPVTYDLSYSSSLTTMSTPVSSLPTSQPLDSMKSSSSSFLPLSGNTSCVSQTSPTARFQLKNSSDSTPVMAVRDIKPDSPDCSLSGPSPIHSSTPMLPIEDREVVNIPIVSHGYNQISQSNFSPITAHEFAQEHKENRPSDHSPSVSLSQEGRVISSQENSAFQKFIPLSLPSSSSSSSPKAQQPHQPTLCTQHPISASTTSSLPTPSSQNPASFQSSHYSPISPASSPIPAICSMGIVSVLPSSLPVQQIYHYNGYEPYPILSVTSSSPSSCTAILSQTPPHPSSSNLSQSTPTSAPTTSSSALNLCIKRNESHDISPETMWRPW